MSGRVVVCWLCLAALSETGCADPVRETTPTLQVHAPVGRPNFILIVLDDANPEDLSYMPIVQRELVERGTTFRRAYTTTSLCCPARASILTGEYAHNHRVRTNKRATGGFPFFHASGDEASTLAVWLQNAGYRTGLIGKYLNLYPDNLDDYVPPGWSDWHALVAPSSNETIGYYDFSMVENGTTVAYPSVYQTDVLTEKAMTFIRTSADTAFFLYLAPFAPHAPATPAPRDAGAFASEPLPMPPSFNEADVTDKPTYVDTLPLLDGPGQMAYMTELYRNRLASLLAVDDMVGQIINQMQRLRLQRNTYIILTSDHGFHIGQHRLRPGKDLLYEEDLTIPLVMRGPSVSWHRYRTELALNIDIAPTVAALAGIGAPDADGRSLVPLLGASTPASWREAFLAETWDSEKAGIKWSIAAIHTRQYSFVEWSNGEDELYDNLADPYQLDNAFRTSPLWRIGWLSGWLDRLRTCHGTTCRLAEDGP